MRNIPVELRKRYIEEGWWTPDTLGELLARGLAANPDTGFWVHSAVRPFSGTFRDVEVAVTFWASAFLGAVVVPVVHFYGRKELTHIIGTRGRRSSSPPSSSAI